MAANYREIKRVTLSGSTFEEISFVKPNEKYLVKNFTSGDIYVAFASDATTTNSIKIKSNFYEIVSNGVWSQEPWDSEASAEFQDLRSTKLYIKGTGEVEIQQV